MSEHTPDPTPSIEPADVVAEWNPLATVESTTAPVPSSGGRASVILRPWSGRARLAYEDALTISLVALDDGGDGTVKMGSLRLYATSLTVIGSTGFPPAPDGRVLLSGTREQVASDLMLLSGDVYDEIRKLAADVQPIPSAGGPDDDGDENSDDAGDPSPAS